MRDLEEPRQSTKGFLCLVENERGLLPQGKPDDARKETAAKAGRGTAPKPCVTTKRMNLELFTARTGNWATPSNHATYNTKGTWPIRTTSLDSILQTTRSGPCLPG